MVWRRAVALLFLYGVLAGCNSGTSSGGSSTPDTETSGKSDGGALSWVPFGPKDPKFPTPYWPAYNALADGKCSELQAYLRDDTGGLKGTDIATAMLALCRAAVNGQSNQWPLVEKYAGADPGPLGNDCLASLVTDLLARSVTWHQAHPGAKPEVKFQRVTSGSGQTECGRTEGQPTDGSSPTAEPTSESTEQGSPTESSPTLTESPG
ncbi:hypothetical protein ACFV9C_40400 [Kribbella sp. NPDC059898]|uniref:hypothetical protein n=1 Tax=Kribbella sp. NPDC059898 TaxID=3346995 RepID=UPI00364EEBD8